MTTKGPVLRRRRGVTAALTAGSLAVASALMTLLPARAAEARVRLAGHVPAVAQSSSVVGDVDPGTPLQLTVALTPRRPIPRDGTPARPLTPAQFAAVYGADDATIAAVRAYLDAQGVRVIVVAPNRLMLQASTTVGQAEAAFDVRETSVRLPSGRTARTVLDDPAVPASLAPRIRAVVGLDSVAEYHSHLSRLPRRAAITAAAPNPACNGQQAPPGATPYQPSQLANVYGLSGYYSQSMTGQGQTAAAYELDGYDPKDVANYQNCYGLHATTVTPVPVYGGSPMSAGSNAAEVDLDVDVLLGELPGLSRLLVYEAPNTARGAVDEFAKIVNDNAARVVSVSFGDCEADLTAQIVRTEADIFAQAALQGQTIVAASGDTGSSDCIDPTTQQPRAFPNVDDPGAQAQVVAAGGTSLNPGMPAGDTYQVESAWNDHAHNPSQRRATGGGPSQYWTQPAYQAVVDGSPGGNPRTQRYAPPCATSGGPGAACREVPDVSADADPATGYFLYCTTAASGCGPGPAGWQPAGGTSLASPLWAAIFTLLDQYRTGHGQTPVGDAHGLLYNLSTAPGSPFRDVVPYNGVSSNDVSGLGAYPVTPGYDMAAGLGSPDAFKIAVLPPPQSYWLVATDGGIFTFGNAQFFGSKGGQPLNQPVVAMATAPDAGGYWLVASDGGIFAFGKAQFFGSTGGQRLNKPVVGMAATPDGGGYWLVASDGGIFAFGNAQFYGSKGGQPLNQPIVGMSAASDGRGYWLVAADGGIFSFGPGTQFYGSQGGKPLNKPVVGMAATTTGHGYWLVATDGGIFSFGDAQFLGSTGGTVLNRPVVGMARTATSGGYWLDASDGGIFTFGDAQFHGSKGGQPLNRPVVGMAAAA